MLNAGGGIGPGTPDMGPRPWGGIPWRGPLMDLKDGDSKQPVLARDAKVKIFDMSKPEDLKEYERVINEIANEHYVFGREEMQFNPKKGNWLIFLRWYAQYMESPKTEHVAGGNGHAKSW